MEEKLTEKRAPSSGGPTVETLNLKLATLKRIVGKVWTGGYGERVEGTNKVALVKQMLTDAVLSRHLARPREDFSISVYLVPPGGNTTQILVIDLDDHDNRFTPEEMNEAAKRVIKAAEKFGLVLNPVQSGGGRGRHLWAILEKPQPLAAVCGMAREVLDLAGFRQESEFKFVDDNALEAEIFPKCDTEIPADGFSAPPIALPFARQSVPLDPESLVERSDPTLWVSSSVAPDAPMPRDAERPKMSRSQWTVELVAEMLASISPTSRYVRTRIAACLKHDTCPLKAADAFEVWRVWLNRAPFKPMRKPKEVWDSFKARSGSQRQLKFWTAVYMAQKEGWQAPEGLLGEKKKGDQFTIKDGAIHMGMFSKGQGWIEVPLCNFIAQATEFSLIDDGTTIKEYYKISGMSNTGVALPTLSLALDKLSGRWWDAWPSALVSETGDKQLWRAIKAISQPIPQHTTYAHTGWRMIDEQSVFLHAGGAVGAKGEIPGVTCQLTGALSDYILEEPTDLAAAIQASLDLLKLSRTGVLAFALAYRAPLCHFITGDLTGWLAGRSGSLKSGLAGLAMGHFGRKFDYSHLPSNWNDTVNALRVTQHLAKDVLLVVDDLAAVRSDRGTRDQAEKVDMICRAQANHAGRGRLTADIQLRNSYLPRGISMGTGEYVPSGVSNRARMVIAEISRGELDFQSVLRLDACVKKGLFVQAMTGYIKYLAANTDGLAKRLAARRSELTGEGDTKPNHRRTTSNSASLIIGLEMALDYAQAKEVISAPERQELLKTACDRLGEITGEQISLIKEEDEATRFREAFVAMMSSGRTHLAAKSGDGPPNGWEVAAGWRRSERYFEGNRIDMWMPQGAQIGWMDGNTIYLLPAAAVSEVERFEHSRGVTLGLDVAHVGKRLRDSKMLLETGEGRTTKLVRVGKMTRWCWKIGTQDWLNIAVDGDGAVGLDLQGGSDDVDNGEEIMEMSEDARRRQEVLAKDRRKLN